jgi:hypothetical protein
VVEAVPVVVEVVQDVAAEVVVQVVAVGVVVQAVAVEVVVQVAAVVGAVNLLFSTTVIICCLYFV